MEPTLSRRTVLKTAGALTIVSAGSSHASASAMTDRHGPVRTGRFKVEVDDVEIPGWRYVTIPSSSTEAGEYREGGEPDWEKKIWGQTTFDDLEMERGIKPGDSALYDWREAVRMGDVDDGRKDVRITLLDEEGSPQIRWEFQDAWIRDYEPPTLDAGANDVSTETATFAFDTMVTDWNPNDELIGHIQTAPPEPEFGDEVTFDGSESSPAEEIESYEWEFGDGTTATAETVTHTVTATGEYPVELTITRGAESETETVEFDLTPPGLGYYTDTDGVTDEDSTAEAFEHWEEGHIDTELLLDVINAGDEGGDGED